MAGLRLRSASGSFSPVLIPTAVKTTAYTAAVGDLAMMNVAGGATALTLPAAPADKSQVGYRAIGATTAVPLTVTAGGTDTIGTAGAATASIVLADEIVVLQYQASGTRWLAVSNVKTQASLDSRFVGASATDSGGRTYTLKLDAANSPSTGTRGLVISRSAQGFPVGIRFEDTAGSDVAEIGLDSSTTDFVLYDDVTNGDILRFAQGGYALLGRGVGHPGNTRRLDITSSSTDSTLASLLHFTNDTSSSTTDFIRGQNGASDVFNINKSGQAAFGKTYSGTVSGGSLEVANAAVISAGVGVTPGLQIITTGNATNRAWTWQISTADGSISLKDSTGGNSPLQLQAGAASNTVLIGTAFLRLGAAASTVGFYANSGAAQSTGWTTMTGTATKAGAGFDTSTVTTAQLAQVVKAIVDRILAMNMVSA